MRRPNGSPGRAAVRRRQGCSIAVRKRDTRLLEPLAQFPAQIAPQLGRMVAVDESGRPASVPPLQLQTQVQKRRQHAAQLRRDLRKELGERFEQARVAFPDGD